MVQPALSAALFALREELLLTGEPRRGPRARESYRVIPECKPSLHRPGETRSDATAFARRTGKLGGL